MPSRAGEARLRSGGLALPSPENVAILKRKKGGKCANTHRPVWGTSPGFVQSKFFAPVREPPPTGATALEVHKMNRHSRKNGGKPSCQHVPEEVSHGENLLSGGGPTAATYPRIPRKAMLITPTPFGTSGRARRYRAACCDPPSPRFQGRSDRAVGR